MPTASSSKLSLDALEENLDEEIKHGTPRRYFHKLVCRLLKDFFFNISKAKELYSSLHDFLYNNTISYVQLAIFNKYF